MAMIEEHFFDDRDELIQALTARCEARLARSVVEDGAASLFVSGGSTPAPLYQALSNRDIDWSSVGVGLVDDRWVDAGHEASNERLVREHLLCNKAKTATFYPMKMKDRSAKEASDRINDVYQSKLNWPGDVVILGMGPDGHTASLFPRAEGLEWGLNPENPNVCCAIEAIPSAVTGAYTERLSLTLSALRNTNELVLLITGAEKLAVYQSAKIGQKSVADCPITALLTDKDVTVSVYWAP